MSGAKAITKRHDLSCLSMIQHGAKTYHSDWVSSHPKTTKKTSECFGLPRCGNKSSRETKHWSRKIETFPPLYWDISCAFFTRFLVSHIIVSDSAPRLLCRQLCISVIGFRPVFLIVYLNILRFLSVRATCNREINGANKSTTVKLMLLVHSSIYLTDIEGKINQMFQIT